MEISRALDSHRADAARDKRLEFLRVLRETGSVRAAAKQLNVGKSTYYRTTQNANLQLIQANRHHMVLVVDDKHFKRFEIQDELLANGVLCDLAESAEQALSMMEKRSYTCIVTDQKMDSMDGIGLGEAILERDPQMPIILLSGHADVTLTRHAFKRGFRDVFEFQNIDWKELAAAVTSFSDAYLATSKSA